jgi:hypothetical protein
MTGPAASTFIGGGRPHRAEHTPVVARHGEHVGLLGDQQRERISQRRRVRRPHAVRGGTQVQLGKRVQRQGLQRPVGADELRDEAVRGPFQDRLGRVVLHEPAARAENRDAVAHLDRLVDVVRNKHDRLPHLALQTQELVLEPSAHDRIDGAERFVHQHQRRVRGKCPREADTLTLSAR